MALFSHSTCKVKIKTHAVLYWMTSFHSLYTLYCSSPTNEIAVVIIYVSSCFYKPAIFFSSDVKIDILQAIPSQNHLYLFNEIMYFLSHWIIIYNY